MPESQNFARNVHPCTVFILHVYQKQLRAGEDYFQSSPLSEVDQPCWKKTIKINPGLLYLGNKEVRTL